MNGQKLNIKIMEHKLSTLNYERFYIMKTKLMTGLLLASLGAFSLSAVAGDNDKRDADASLAVFGASIFGGYARVTPEVKNAPRDADASLAVFGKSIFAGYERVTPAVTETPKTAYESSRLFTDQFESKRYND